MRAFWLTLRQRRRHPLTITDSYRIWKRFFHPSSQSNHFFLHHPSVIPVMIKRHWNSTKVAGLPPDHPIPPPLKLSENDHQFFRYAKIRRSQSSMDPRRERDYMALIEKKQFIEAGDLVLEWLQDSSSGAPVDTSLLCHYLNALFKNRQIPTALQYYQKLLIDYQVPQDAALIATVAVGLLQPTLGSDIIPELSITLDSLLKISSPILKDSPMDLSNPLLCLHILDSLCTHPQHYLLSDRFLDYMQETLSGNPDFQEIMRTGYIIFLKTLFHHGMVNEAFALFNRILSLGIEPGKDLFALMIASIHKQLGIVDMLEFYQMFKNYLQIQKSDPRRLQEYVHVFNTVIQAFSKMGKMDEAEKVFEEMKTFHLAPTLDTFKMLLIGYCRIREDWSADKENVLMDEADFLPSADSAMEIVDTRIAQAGLIPDRSIYQILLRGLAVRQDSDEMMTYYEKMMERGFTGDETTALSFSDAAARKEPEPTLVKGHFISYIPPAQDTSPPLDIETQARIRLIEEHCRRDDIHGAIDEFQAFIARGIKPTLKMYTSVIAACAAQNEVDKGKELMDDMESRGIRPDAYIYHILMNLQVQDEPQKVLDWYRVMHENGIPDYDYILELVFEAYINLNDLGSAEVILKKLTIESPVNPSRQTYYKLIRFLMRSPKLSVPLLSPLPKATLNQRGWIYGKEKADLSQDYYLEREFLFRKSNPKAVVQPSNFAMSWAVKLFEDMVRRGHKPSKSTLFHLSLGYITRDENQKLWDLYEASWIKFGQHLDLDFRGIVYSHFWESDNHDIMVKAICLAMDHSENAEEDWNLLRHLVFDRCIKEPPKSSPESDDNETADESSRNVISEYDGSEKLVGSLQKLHVLFRDVGRNLSPSLWSDALHYTANVSKNIPIFFRLWKWMVEENLVIDIHIAYYIEYLVLTDRWEQIYYYCTEWMTERKISMTSEGLACIASVFHQAYLGLFHSAVLMYWQDKDSALIKDSSSKNSSFVP